MRLKRLICVGAAVLGFSGALMIANVAAAAAAGLTGGGSTLVQPLEALWAASFQRSTGNSVAFLAFGSGTGVNDAAAGRVDFGASDAPASAYPGVCHGCTWIPWALGATGIGYNLPNGKSGVKLSGQVLSEIYLGKITNWDSSAIANLNKGRRLPNLKITLVARADASGDSYALTDFLSDVNPAFRSKIGGATVQPAFPNAVLATGNAGEGRSILSISGAIGYVSASLLLTDKIQAARIENQAGNYEYPALANIESAASNVGTIPKAGVHIVNPPKSDSIAYPISTFTNVVIPAQPANPALIKQFLTFAVTTGRSMGEPLDFAPLPTVVQHQDEALINGIS